MAVRRRYIDYHATLPTPGGGLSSRRILASIASVTFHLLLVVLVLRYTAARAAEQKANPTQATERPVQLFFDPPKAPPRPQPQSVDAPQPQDPVTPPPAPLTPGRDQTPGSIARVTPDPEKNPNAAPDIKPADASRPDPGDAEAPSPDKTATETPPLATSDAASRPTVESEARRIFGRPSALLGPAAGTRSSRPWESPQQTSNGCTLPEEEQDSTLPKGMAMVQGRIFREDNGKPLAGARLQILGTQFGTFSNDKGDYKLVFDRTLVDRCRTQSVRVTAPGYQGRDVLLYLGERASSDVALPRW